MKKTILFFAFMYAVLVTSVSSGQIGYTTKYYDYFSNPQVVYANDVAEDIVSDASDNTYVAGEQMKEMSTQAIHVIKYNASGVVATQGTYDNVNYREYVKKVVYDGSTYLYVVCNAVHITTGAQSLLVLKYSATSLVTPLSADFFSTYHSPVDAAMAGSGINGYLFIACKKPNGNATSLAALRLTKTTTSNNMYIQYSYLYNFLNVSDQYQENPKDILYSQTDQAVYVAGGVTDTVTGKSATLIIRLATTMGNIYSLAGTLDSGQNVYNSVALNSSYVYVAGSKRNNPNNKHSWVIRRLKKSDGSTLSSRVFNPGTNYYSEAMKITLAGSSDILVAGYSKNSNTSVYNVQIGKYDATLSGSASYMGSSFPYNTVLRDAISTTGGTTYLTGNKGSHMFLLAYNALGNGSNYYRDSIISNGAAGNRIALLSLGTNQFAVAGYQDKTSNIFQPHDYQMFTRFYSYIIERIEDQQEAVSVSVYPNPASDYIRIKSQEPVLSYRLFDMQGRIITWGKPAEETMELELPIRRQPAGIYFLVVNEGKAHKIVKN